MYFERIYVMDKLAQNIEIEAKVYIFTNNLKCFGH